MACYYPLTQYLSQKHPVNDKGNPNYVFNTKEGHFHTARQIPCGQCWGCRLERSRIWAIRCMHEAQFHEHNQFLTLTYNEENLPANNSLLKSDLQKFWKRLRKKHNIRYYACGEYGDLTHRPHYHAIIFGLNIDDKIYKCTDNGNKLFTSKKIERLWNHGHVTIGNVSFESCAYVARYIMKKITGQYADNHYQIIDKETGQVNGQREPEFTNMSRNPGISTNFYNKFKSDIYQAGTDGRTIIRGGITCKPSKFYEDKFEKENPIQFKIIKKRREQEALLRAKDNTRERLIVKEKLALSIINKQLPRKLE